MDIRSLKTLVAVADHGSFLAAGEAVGLSQSAVSLQIKGLESAVSVALFDRSRRPPVLNTQGITFVQKARVLLAMWSDLTQLERPDSVAGRLQLGAIPTVLSGALPLALAHLQDTHPDLKIQLTSGLSDELVPRVINAELDCAIVSEPARLEPGLSWHAFASEALVVIAPANCPGDDDRTILESLPFIRFKRFAWAGRLIDTQLRNRGINVNQRMEMDSLEGIARMVEHGLGVSIVPLRLNAPAFAENIKVTPFGTPPVQRVVGVLERSYGPKSGQIQVLHSILTSISASAQGAAQSN